MFIKITIIVRTEDFMPDGCRDGAYGKHWANILNRFSKSFGGAGEAVQPSEWVSGISMFHFENR